LREAQLLEDLKEKNGLTEKHLHLVNSIEIELTSIKIRQILIMLCALTVELRGISSKKLILLLEIALISVNSLTSATKLQMERSFGKQLLSSKSMLNTMNALNTGVISATFKNSSI
jgi:hypothetical protein